MSKIKVGIVFGGKSAEHEVSLMSVTSVLNVIDESKYALSLFYITKHGEWLNYSGDVKTIQADSYNTCTKPLSADILTRLYQQDVIFPIIHGPHGEDGSLQGLFESLEIPYVGSKVLGSAVCMDKIISKKILKQAGLSAVSYFEMYEKVEENSYNALVKWIKTVGYPVFVKPSNMGSSVGISKVNDESQLRAALEDAFKYDHRLLIEEGINGREIECAVLEYKGIQVSGVGEVIASNDFYDYEAKYTDDGEEKMMVPAENISEEILRSIQALAKRAFLEHGCNGLARVDFFLEHGTNRIVLNEINTLPGMTAFSMYPSLFESIGIPYTKLIDHLIENVIDCA